MKIIWSVLCMSVFVLQAQQADETRCSNCEKQKQNQKDAALQAAALGLMATAVNGAFAVAANPDDKNAKLQAGNAIALGFIGLVAAAMRTLECDIYDAQGNKISPEQLASTIADKMTRVMQDAQQYTDQPI